MDDGLMLPILLAIGVGAFGAIVWIVAHAWQGKRARREERSRAVRWRVAEIAGERRQRARQ